MKRLLSCLVALPIFLLGSCGETESAQEPLSAPSSVTPTTIPTKKPVRPKPITPQGIHILGVTAPITPIGLDGDELIPPSDPDILGWWGKKAGSKHGVTLLVGHTVHTGGGTLDDLESVPIGRVLEVRGWSEKPDSSKAYQKLDYKVISNKIISKTALAKHAQSLFSQVGKPYLVIVTCEDYNWSTGEYASNVVLVADPIR